MDDARAGARAVYRLPSPEQAAALVPWVRSAADALGIPVDGFDPEVAARHLAGLLEQARVVTAAPVPDDGAPALRFLP
jgi:hypothetical protein